MYSPAWPDSNYIDLIQYTNKHDKVDADVVNQRNTHLPYTKLSHSTHVLGLNTWRSAQYTCLHWPPLTMIIHNCCTTISVSIVLITASSSNAGQFSVARWFLCIRQVAHSFDFFLVFKILSGNWNPKNCFPSCFSKDYQSKLWHTVNCMAIPQHTCIQFLGKFNWNFNKFIHTTCTVHVQVEYHDDACVDLLLLASNYIVGH